MDGLELYKLLMEATTQSGWEMLSVTPFAPTGKALEALNNAANQLVSVKMVTSKVSGMLKVLDQDLAWGTNGDYWHGYCAGYRYGLDALLEEFTEGGSVDAQRDLG